MNTSKCNERWMGGFEYFRVHVCEFDGLRLRFADTCFDKKKFRQNLFATDQVN